MRRKTLKPVVHKRVLRNDPIAQLKSIEEALKRFTDLLDSRLDYFPEEVQRMLRYIHEHLFEDTLTVEKVKTACLLTDNNVTTRFRQTVGVGTRQYIVYQRLKAAASVLHTTEVKVYLLASAIGYTEETFSKLFKKAYSCSPLHYRKGRAKRNAQEK